MKKIIILILIFCSFWASAQLSSAKINRIQNNYTPFGFNIPKGDILFDVAGQRFYGVLLARTAAETIADLTIGTNIKEFGSYPTNGYVGTSTGTSWGNTVTTASLMLNNQNNSTGSYTITSGNFILNSDRRLKFNIQKLSEKDYSNIAKIDFRKFYMHADSTQLRFGVIAQDVEKIIPELVRTDEKGIKSVAYIDLLIAKIAELEQRIIELEKRK